MTAATVIEVYEKSDIQNFEDYASQVNSWSIGLWWDDLEEAEVARCYFAFDGDKVIGYQTVNSDRLCIAIEVHPDYQGQGVSSALIEESGCWKPERDENPEFWAAVEEKFGY